jgi:hypothetical protein
LVTHPEVLEKAQAEIDAIVGSNHLPDFDNFDSLPYITAITKETLRWRDVVPIGGCIFILQPKTCYNDFIQPYLISLLLMMCIRAISFQLELLWSRMPG